MFGSFSLDLMYSRSASSGREPTTFSSVSIRGWEFVLSHPMHWRPVAPSLLLRGLPTFRMFDTLMRPPLCFWVVEMKYFFERKFVCELYISIFLDLIFLKQWCFNRIWIFLRLFWIMVFLLNFNFNLLIS